MSAARAQGQEANDGEGTGQGRSTGADRLKAQGRAGRRKSAAQTPPLRRHQDNAALQRDPAWTHRGRFECVPRSISLSV